MLKPVSSESIDAVSENFTERGILAIVGLNVIGDLTIPFGFMPSAYFT
jgi:hypothetical protein